MSSSLVSADHLATPVPIPDFSHLTLLELNALRGFIAGQMKEARKKANLAISKSAPALKSLWLTSLSLRSDASEEERKAVIEPFHREILKHPEAFFAYAHANALFVLDRALMAETLLRSKPKGK